MDPEFNDQCGLHELTITQFVSESPTARIYKATQYGSDTIVIIKLIHNLNQIAYSKVKRAYQLQYNLQCLVGVVKVIGMFGFDSSRGRCFAVVMPLIGKDLCKEIEYRKSNGNPWKYEELMSVTKDLVQVLAEMQKKGIAHCNLRLRNIFYDNDKKAKVSNFCLACSMSFGSDIESEISAPAQDDFTFNPEVKDLLTLCKSDVFSLGLVLLSCYHLKTIENESTTRDMIEEMLAGVLWPQYRDLLRSMLEEDLGRRPDCFELRSKVFCTDNLPPSMPPVIEPETPSIPVPVPGHVLPPIGVIVTQESSLSLAHSMESMHQVKFHTFPDYPNGSDKGKPEGKYNSLQAERLSGSSAHLEGVQLQISGNRDGNGDSQTHENSRPPSNRSSPRVKKTCRERLKQFCLHCCR